MEEKERIHSLLSSFFSYSIRILWILLIHRLKDYTYKEDKTD